MKIHTKLHNDNNNNNNIETLSSRKVGVRIKYLLTTESFLISFNWSSSMTFYTDSFKRLG